MNPKSSDNVTQFVPDFHISSPPPRSSSDRNYESYIIVAIVISTAIVVSTSLYFLLRFLSRHFRRVSADGSSFSDGAGGSPLAESFSAGEPRGRRLVDSLPSFRYGSVGGGGKDRDCAICLGRLMPHDTLRLLPICCHAFHADCVDSWLESNRTCPLCRSAVFASESEINKALRSISANADAGTRGSESFRVEIGSVSHRQFPPESGSGRRRSFSIGSFEYVVDEESVATTVRTHRASESSDKDESGAPHSGESLAAEVGPQRSWLREYVDRLASASSSFRSSGRFFAGSSRRSDVAGVGDDILNELEAQRIGVEISEMFRWLSGV